MKKIIFLIVVVLLNGSTKFQEKFKSKYTPDIFIGGSTSLNYLNADKSIDKTNFSFGYYIGNRFFNDFELILKRDHLNASDYKLNNTGIRLNIPVDSLFSRRIYIGLTYGKSKFQFKQKDINNITLSNEKDLCNYYSVTFGKRYKFVNFFYVRFEGEYVKYSNKIETNSIQFKLKNSLKFNFSMEYKF